VFFTTFASQRVYSMKKIIGYRKLLGVDEKATLQDLKTIYRNMMKNWHPDKLQENPELAAEAEVKSKRIIEAYKFLVSIAPETRQAYLEAYTLTTSTIGIADYEYKSETLVVKFVDGSSYEYFGVPKATYVKMVNAPAIARFARRHIFNSFEYRNVNTEVAV
jgi:curved DNA-binding protein CbpA